MAEIPNTPALAADESAASSFQGTTMPPEPPLSSKQKIWAGIIIIGAIILPLWLIIAYWPDTMPISANSYYRYEAMHVTLLIPPTSTDPKLSEKPKPFASDEKDVKKRTVDSVTFIKAETARVATLNKTIAEKAVAEKNKSPCLSTPVPCSCTIQFSTLILILVAAAGFLGNMIFVASSFGAFVGSGKFRRSWILWYFVKPFTGSGLAAILYLAMNNSNSIPGSSTAPLNLNGIIAAAALAGLFTDIATEKLRDIFTAIFKPSDNGPGKQHDQSNVISVDLKTMHPDKIDVNAPNPFLIAGQNLDPQNLIVTILKKKIEPITVTSTLIKFTYIVDEADKTLTKFPLLITDAKGIKLAEKDLGV